MLIIMLITFIVIYIEDKKVVEPLENKDFIHDCAMKNRTIHTNELKVFSNNQFTEGIIFIVIWLFFYFARIVRNFYEIKIWKDI